LASFSTSKRNFFKNYIIICSVCCDLWKKLWRVITYFLYYKFVFQFNFVTHYYIFIVLSLVFDYTMFHSGVKVKRKEFLDYRCRRVSHLLLLFRFIVFHTEFIVLYFYRHYGLEFYHFLYIKSCWFLSIIYFCMRQVDFIDRRKPVFVIKVRSRWCYQFYSKENEVFFR